MSKLIIYSQEMWNMFHWHSQIKTKLWRQAHGSEYSRIFSLLVRSDLAIPWRILNLWIHPLLQEKSTCQSPRANTGMFLPRTPLNHLRRPSSLLWTAVLIRFLAGWRLIVGENFLFILDDRWQCGRTDSESFCNFQFSTTLPSFPIKCFQDIHFFL